MDAYISNLALIFGIDPETLTNKQRLSLSLLVAQAQVDAIHDTKVAHRAFDIIEDMVY